MIGVAELDGVVAASQTRTRRPGCELTPTAGRFSALRWTGPSNQVEGW